MAASGERTIPRSPSAVPHDPRRLASTVVLLLLGLAALLGSVGWSHAAMEGGRFTVGSLGFFLVLWVLMMAAMMFPSVWPAVAVFGLVIRRRAANAQRPRRCAAFVGGYMASWASFGLVAFGLLAAARAGGFETLTSAELARYVVVPVTLAAALYQTVPFKQACLRHCRGPLSFFLEHWRDGARGAFGMGARHGAYCVGCCWMLMLVLLALGVMSLMWMAIVSLAIAVEKLAPPRSGRLGSRVLATGLVAVALVALVKPSWLPAINGMGDGRQMKTQEMTK